MEELFTSLEELLKEHFESVRLTMVQNVEQFAQEVKAVNVNKLPAVLVIFDTHLFQSFEGIEETQLTVVLIDSFASGSREKVLSMLEKMGVLLSLFPADGRKIASYHCYPTDVVTATPDPRFAALALGISCKK